MHPLSAKNCRNTRGSEYEIPAIFPTFSRVMEIRYRALKSWEGKGKKKKIKQNEKIKPRLISPVSDPLRKK